MITLESITPGLSLTGIEPSIITTIVAVVSNVDPLPHQITAVCESMLPQQPLRFVLADDPGSGKTIMAG